MRNHFIALFIVLFVFGFMQLSGTKKMPVDNCNNYGTPQTPGTDKGIGPFQNITLAPIDKVKVKSGLSIFTNKCTLCHELDINKVGPPIRNAFKTYTPEFILNMIVNPLEMQKSNSTAKELLKKYNNVPMPDQKIPQQDALAILEYLRSIVK